MNQVKQYIRDGRSPIPKDDKTSALMSKVRGRNTKPELLVRQALLNTGLRGYRLHYVKVSGRPDICFVGKKIAIFVHGCFWHRCPYCRPSLPKNHRAFWKNKFNKNIDRDKRNVKSLRDNGWKVVICWECRVKNDLPKLIMRIKRHVG